MRKIMVIQHCGAIGGSGIGLLAVLNMLKEKFNIVVYCIEQPNHLYQLYKDNKYNVKAFSSIPVFLYHSGGPRAIDVEFIAHLIKIKKDNKTWEQIIREEHPDVVLVNSMILCWMWKAIKQSGAKAICHVREVLPNRFSLRSKYVIDSLNHFDAVWFISQHEQSYFDLKTPLTTIIRDSLTVTTQNHEYQMENIKIKEENFHVLFVGGLSKLKGISILLKSIKYTHNDIIFDIAGYLPRNAEDEVVIPINRNLIKRIILSVFLSIQRWEKNKLLKVLFSASKYYPERINLLGHRENLNTLYNSCDVLVFPSWKPHQSRPAFEAGFFGKPVIISDFKQTQENVQDEYNGLTFKPNNPKSLARAINKLNRDRSLCKRLGENNYKNSMEKHTIEAVQAEMDKFWRECSK